MLDEDITQTQLPAPIEKSKFYAVAIGFDYVLPFYYRDHDNQILLFSEYYRGQYENKSLLSLPLSNILTSGLRISLLDDRLKTDFVFINDFDAKGSMGSIRLSYLFLNGLMAELDYNIFDGVVEQQNDLASIFYYMRKRPETRKSKSRSDCLKGSCSIDIWPNSSVPCNFSKNFLR